MVGVAQLVEPRIVIPVVVGSSPIVHPKFGLVLIVEESSGGPLAQLGERREPRTPRQDGGGRGRKGSAC